MVLRCVWESVLEDLLAEGVPFALEQVGPAHHLSSQVEAANPGEKACMGHCCLGFTNTFMGLVDFFIRKGYLLGGLALSEVVG